MTSHVYLSPGMFGFARLAAYEYFEHVEAAIERRFRARGRNVALHVCEVHPTASIRRRAAKLAAMIDETAGSAGPIHILGHSTGGLDARLIASPSVHLVPSSVVRMEWLARLRSISTLNTPHYGTPLATFFATAKGQRLLYAVSALTVTALKLGSPPLAIASALVAALARTNELSVELTLVDRVTEAVTRVLDEAASVELRSWLRMVRDDQGSIVQLMPESMDLFEAGVENRPGVRYQCVASFAPTAGVRDWLRAVRAPWVVVSTTLFHLMYQVTAAQDDRYPCMPSSGYDENAVLACAGELPPRTANDGVVPFYSQLWGELVWAGRGDHLDTVGHFPGRGGHTDWLASGARYDQVRFDAMMDRIVEGMLIAE